MRKLILGSVLLLMTGPASATDNGQKQSGAWSIAASTSEQLDFDH
jgi:hypothetical protein